MNDLYRLADYFDVTIEYMQNALNFYLNKYGNMEVENVYVYN